MVEGDLVLQKWLAARQEIASRVFTVPPKVDLLASTLDGVNLKSEIDQRMLTNISKGSGRTLNALGITNLLIESYNQIVLDERFDRMEVSILMVTLDSFSSLITKDKDAVRMIRENLDHAREMTQMRRSASQNP